MGEKIQIMSYIKIHKLNYLVANKYIIKDICISIKKNEVLAIVGSSGSGKTSLLRSISGIIRPSSGKISVNNKIILDDNFYMPIAKRKIGLMFQENVLFPHLNVFENISFGINGMNKELIKEKTYNLINRFELNKIYEAYPETLSGGEQQRVALARALGAEPNIMLLDEPFSSLDAFLRMDICDYTVETLKKANITSILVTHDAEEAMRVSDKIAVMEKGKLIQEDTPVNIYNKPHNTSALRMLGKAYEFESKVLNNIIKTPFGNIDNKKLSNNDYVRLFIRSENIKVNKTGTNAIIKDIRFVGRYYILKLFFEDKWPICNLYLDKSDYFIGQEIKVMVDPSMIAVLTS